MSLALETSELPHYTHEDYLKWEGRWELISGIPFAMTPSPGYRHQTVSQNIALQLGELLKETPFCRAMLPIDWQITEDTVVQPDNMVICGDNTDDNKLTLAPVLIFEIISPSTTRKDKGIKYQLYQEAGVKYYCIVDPVNHEADVFVLKQDKYKAEEAFAGGKMKFDLGCVEIAFDFNEIFKH